MTGILQITNDEQSINHHDHNATRFANSHLELETYLLFVYCDLVLFQLDIGARARFSVGNY